MTKIVARRNKAGQIEMLRQPEEPRYLSEGDIRFYRKQYQEFRKPGAVNYYWRDVTDEVAAVLRQTFTAAPTPPAAPQENQQ